MIPGPTFEQFVAECKARNLDGESVRRELNALRAREAAKTRPSFWNRIKRLLTSFLKGIAMKRNIFAVLALVVVAALAVALFVPISADAGGPYFSSLYAKIKLVNSGYETIADSLRVGKTATFDGAIDLNSTYAMGQDAFVGNAQTDTVTISGAATTDKYVITVYGAAAADTITVPLVQVTATGFVLHRTAATAEGNQAYTWLRSK